MLGTYGEAKNQLLTDAPFILRVNLNAAEKSRRCRPRAKSLNQSCEINVSGGCVKTPFIKRLHGLWIEFTMSVKDRVFLPMFSIHPHSKAELVIAADPHNVVGDLQIVRTKRIQTDPVESP